VSDVAIAEHFHRIGQPEKGAEGKPHDSVGFVEVTLFKGTSANLHCSSPNRFWLDGSEQFNRSVRRHPLLCQSADRPCLAQCIQIAIRRQKRTLIEAAQAAGLEVSAGSGR
jgi:hypothetical protein